MADYYHNALVARMQNPDAAWANGWPTLAERIAADSVAGASRQEGGQSGRRCQPSAMRCPPTRCGGGDNLTGMVPNIWDRLVFTDSAHRRKRPSQYVRCLKPLTK